MHEDTRQVLCEKCRKFVPVSSIKYVAKGYDAKAAMCISCLAKSGGDIAKKSNVSSQSQAYKPSYTCTRCRYKFKYDPAKGQSLRCPYCGRSDRLTEDRMTTAESILKEADF